MRLFLSAALFTVALLVSTAQAQETYKVDPEHSFVVFKVGHLGAGTAWGRFNDPTGSVTVRDGAPTALSVEVQTEKVDTDNDRRDNHLRSPDFFNAAQYPTITFKSTAITKKSDDEFEVKGQLSAHGETKDVTVTLHKVGEASNPQMGQRIGYDTELTINRQDFGIAGVPGGVGNDVTLYISLETVKE